MMKLSSVSPAVGVVMDDLDEFLKTHSKPPPDGLPQGDTPKDLAGFGELMDRDCKSYAAGPVPATELPAPARADADATPQTTPSAPAPEELPATCAAGSDSATEPAAPARSGTDTTPESSPRAPAPDEAATAAAGEPSPADPARPAEVSPKSDPGLYLPTRRVRRPRYRILRRIGEGRWGEVFEAERLRDGSSRRVALKFLKPEALRRREDTMAPRLRASAAYCPGALRAFLFEARILAILDHPNVIGVHEVGRSSDRYYMELEYMPGGNLREFLARFALDSVPLELLLDLMTQACKGMAAVEDLGIVHGDLKPENLLVDPSGSWPRLGVADLNLARWSEAASSRRSGARSIGTPRYSSPEACRFEPLSTQSDIFSLGLVFAGLLARRPVVVAVSPYECMQRIVRIDGVCPARYQGAPVPQPLRQTIETMTAARPSERFGSFHDVLRALEDCRRGRPISGDILPPRPARPLRLVRRLIDRLHNARRSAPPREGVPAQIDGPVTTADPNKVLLEFSWTTPRLWPTSN